jgi:hypothetical protein
VLLLCFPALDERLGLVATAIGEGVICLTLVPPFKITL